MDGRMHPPSASVIVADQPSFLVQSDTEPCIRVLLYIILYVLYIYMYIK